MIVRVKEFKGYGLLYYLDDEDEVYSDELGTKYLIHEVTDARGYIIHRDFDAVRISSGQLINKGH